MARCATSGENFIHFVYSPCVSLHVSKDTEALCLKDNLTFAELLKPFSQLSKDVVYRDNNNLAHTVSNLRLKFIDSNTPPPTAAVARVNLREIVNSCASNQTLHNKRFSSGSLNISVPVTTPWFEAWRYVFIQSLWPNTHEFLDHSLASIFVVSTNHPDPVGELVRLSDEQTQQQCAADVNYPRWFASNIVKFYVLVHDASQSARNCPEETFKRMENHFGSASCYFLPLFSVDQLSFLDGRGFRSEQNGQASKLHDLTRNVASTEDDITPDPWLSHLLPNGYCLNPTKEGSSQNDKVSSIPLSDPLVSDQDNVDGGFHSEFGDGIAPNSIAFSNGTTRCSLIHPRHCKPHGRHLTQADRDRIRAFVYEFVTRALLPWVEQTMRSLSDQIAHRMRLSRSFFSATKKFFSSAVGGGSGSSSQTTTITTTNPSSSSTVTPNSHSSAAGLLNSVSTPSLIGMSGSGGNWPPGSSETVMARNTIAQFGSKEDVQLPVAAATTMAPVVVYATEAPEMQMRRLADLAFLFQQYEVAYQTYNVLKRDFQNDTAWLHYAAAQEMSALSIYLQGTNSQRQYPYQYVDSSVTIYLQTCQAAELALRATLLNTEALCSRGLYAEAAMSLLRLTSQDDDLTSGLLIEQTAHCVLNLRRPMLRKFAFRMALAAHRYNRAKQSHLAIRSYNVAAPILIGRRWSLIEDHVNFNVGKQAYLIGDLATSVTALSRNLTQFSRQSAERQSLFVREYLVVLKQFLASCSTNGSAESLVWSTYAIFPLPSIRFRDVKVMLGKPFKQSEELLSEARGVQFDDSEELANEHAEVEAVLGRLGPGAWSEAGPEWMESTDVSDSDDDNEFVLNPRTTETTESGPSHLSSPGHLSPVNLPIPGLLERLLLQAMSRPVAGKQAKTPAPPRQHLVLQTAQTAVSHQPPQPRVAPVGEYLTVQIPLENPMRIPLVLANLHLLWSFQSIPTDPSGNSTATPIKPVTNETPLEQAQRTIRQVVANETIPELIMLPGESKALEVSVLPKQMGQLDITGLCFDWIYPSPQHLGQSPSNHGMIFSAGPAVDVSQPPKPNGSLTLVQNGGTRVKEAPSRPPPPTGGYRTDVNSVRGKISLVPKSIHVNGDHSESQRLSLSTSSVSSSALGSASSLPPCLSWTITRPAALLRVTFSDFPVKLMQGQVYRLNLSLTNTGCEPLDTIRVASNWFGFIGFPSDATSCQMTASNTTMPFETAPTDIVTNPFRLFANQQIQPWLSVPIHSTNANKSSASVDSSVQQQQKQTLLPGSSVLIPMWLRAPHLSCSFRRSGSSPKRLSHAGHLLPTADLPAMSELRTVHMVFQYTCTTPNPAYPMLNARFVRHRSDVEFQPSLRFEALATRTPCFGPHEILIRLMIQNVTSDLIRTSFDILQVSCASRLWVLKPIGRSGFDGIDSRATLRPGEVLTLNLRAVLLTADALNPDSSRKDSHVSVTPSSQTVFSTIPLVSVAGQASQSTAILSTSSPCIDFYCRSGSVRTQWTKQLQHGMNSASHHRISSCQLDITLLVFWRTHAPRSDHSDVVAYGQSHVPLRRLGHPVTIPVGYQTSARRATRKPRLDMDPRAADTLVASVQSSSLSGAVRDAALIGACTTALSNLSGLVRLRLRHPSQLHYPFSAETVRMTFVRSPLSVRSPLAPVDHFSGRESPRSHSKDSSSPAHAITQAKYPSLIKIPIEAELFNTTTVAVQTVLEAVLDENRFNEPSASGVTSAIHDAPTPLQDTAKHPAIARVLWTGLTRKHFLLQPGEVRQLTLYARTARSGLFDVSSLVLKAAPVSNEPTSADTFVRQSITPSFVLIDAHGAFKPSSEVGISPSSDSPSLLTSPCL